MSYMKIPNLYKDQSVLQFKEVFCLEKIEGTSSWIRYKDGKINFFSGGAKREEFVKLFDEQFLLSKFQEVDKGHSITIYGEAYGGKLQGMSQTYGKSLKFVAFEVKIGDYWLNVEDAQDFVQNFNLEFVHFVKIPCQLDLLEKEMMANSVQAIRNGLGEHPSEGIIIRPPIEVVRYNGERIIAKYKKPQFRETQKERKIVDPTQLEVLYNAQKITTEWVTLERVRHVADAIQKEIQVENIKDFIKGVIEDIKKEAEGEIVWSKEVEKEIGKETAILIKGLQMKNSKSLQIGDRVAYSVNFLHSIGMYTGDLPHARGIITEVRQIGSMKVAIIDWNDPEIPNKVNINNLAKIGLNTQFCKC